MRRETMNTGRCFIFVSSGREAGKLEGIANKVFLALTQDVLNSSLLSLMLRK